MGRGGIQSAFLPQNCSVCEERRRRKLDLCTFSYTFYSHSLTAQKRLKKNSPIHTLKEYFEYYQVLQFNFRFLFA